MKITVSPTAANIRGPEESEVCAPFSSNVGLSERTGTSNPLNEKEEKHDPIMCLDR